MKNPKLIVKPFAKNGQKNVIPENYETSMESNQATWDQGFGQITMLPVAAGGLPPKGQDFNGIFNQISESIVYLSQGGRFKFSAEYAEAIGGYPKGAILQSDDEKKEYLSLIDNNKVNFNVAADISASWKLVNTDDLLAQIASKQPKGDYATKTELNIGLSGKQPTGDYATKTEVNSKLAKNENGEDIPDKEAFIRNLGLAEGSALPVGVPVPWPREEPPAGWLKCNGARFTATQYPKLAIVYPDLRLPDLRGEFIRGWDDGRGANPGRQILSSEVQSVQRHIHNTEIKSNETAVQKPGNSYNVTLHAGQLGELDNYAWMKTTDTLGTASDETRPRNIAFNYIVRAA